MARELPDTAAVESALARIHKLGEELEAEGFQHMSSRRETTDTGYALHWLGLWLQKQVDDDLIPFSWDPDEKP